MKKLLIKPYKQEKLTTIVQEESGHIQEIKEVLLDCDEDAIIFKVKQVGGACHTGHYSCFYKKLSDDGKVVTEYEDKVFDPEDVYEK